MSIWSRRRDPSDSSRVESATGGLAFWGAGAASEPKSIWSRRRDPSNSSRVESAAGGLASWGAGAASELKSNPPLESAEVPRRNRKR